jgi:hypothetical protein
MYQNFPPYSLFRLCPSAAGDASLIQGRHTAPIHRWIRFTFFPAIFLSILVCSPAFAAVQTDAATSVNQNTASSSITTPAFSTHSGQQLLLAMIATDSISTPNISVKSVTGAGLTWYLVVRTNTQLGTSEIWRAFAPTALTNVKVSASLSQAVVSSMTVTSYTGVNTSGTGGSGAIGAIASGHAASGAPTVTLTTTQANSRIVGVGNDYDAAVARTPLAGQTITHQDLSSTGDTYWMQNVTAENALKGTRITLGDSAPTADQYNLSACEILASTTVSTPQISLSSTSLAFGSVTNGSSKPLTLTLTSSGGASLTISSLTVTGTGFSIAATTLPKVLAPGQTLAVPVTFKPTTTGSLTGKLTIVSNSTTGATSSVSLTGTGVASSPGITLSATTLSYGSVTDGTSKALSLTITSSGTASLTINSFAVTGTGFSIAATALPKTLTTGQTLVIPVTFKPTTAGSLTGKLTIVSNATTGATSVVSLTGTGVASGARIALSASALSFGSVADGTSKALALTITSSGTAPLTINSGTITGTGFAITASGASTTLAAGQSLTVQITFSPKTAGAVTGALTINSNSTTGASSVVSLSGTGVAPDPVLSVSTTSLNFGTVNVSATATLTVTLSSKGTSAVTVSSGTITGAGYSLVGGSFPLTLAPGSTAVITVEFAPTVSGAAAGQLTIASNSLSGATAVVSLTGTAQATATHSVDLTWVAPTTSPTPVAGYHVYRALATSSSTFTLLTSSLDTQTSYVDNTVLSGSTYDYEVRSVDGSGVESTPSNLFTVTIP